MMQAITGWGLIEMKLKTLELTKEERMGLLEIVEKGRDWRMRHRAQTLLYFGDGLRAKAIATQQNLHLDTVYDRRKDWLAADLSSLADKHRSGAPPKVNAAQMEQLRMWATQEALTARGLLTKLNEAYGIVMHPNTLCVTLKKMKFVWKRTRHSLKKNETS